MASATHLQLLTLLLLFGACVGEESISETDKPLGWGLFATLLMFVLLVWGLQSEWLRMRMFMYEIFNNTISIFCAVCIFRAINSAIDCAANDCKPLFHEEDEHKDPIGLRHLLIYRFISAVVWQLTFLLLAKLLVRWLCRQRHPGRKVKSWMKAVLMLAHVCSFAWIFFWGEVLFAWVDQHDDGKDSYQEVLSTVPLVVAGASVASVVVLLMFQFLREGASFCRDRMCGAPDRSMQGLNQEYKETNRDGNIESVSLAVSFLFVQWAKYTITVTSSTRSDRIASITMEHMFQPEGIEGNWSYRHNPEEASRLLQLSLKAWLASVVWQCLGLQLRRFLERRGSGQCRLLENVIDLVRKLLCGFSMWGLYFGTQWFVRYGANHRDENGHPTLPTLKNSQLLSLLAEAVLITTTTVIFCVLVLTVLRCFSRGVGCGGPSSVRAWLTCGRDAGAFIGEQLAVGVADFGVAVGISWERTFGYAVEVISEDAAKKPEMHINSFLPDIPKRVLEILVIFLTLATLVSVWVRFIIPMTEEKGYLLGFVPRLAVRKAKTLEEHPDYSRFPAADAEELLKRLRVMQETFAEEVDNTFTEPEPAESAEPAEGHQPLRDVAAQTGAGVTVSRTWP